MAGVWNPGPGPTEGGDVFNGDAGADAASGLGGADTLSGNGGDDLLDGGMGFDILDGGEGQDLLVGDQGFDQIFGGDGDDIAHGGIGDDFVHGDDGDDWLTGDDGNDRLRGGMGADMLDGGAGVDVASYADAAGGVTVSLAMQGVAQNTIGDGIDTLIGIEQAEGSAFADILTGSSADDLLIGNAGADTLNGGEGVDVLDGGEDQDQLNGGLGNDNVFGAEGDDVLHGGLGQDDLQGNDGADAQYGEDGNDRLLGWAGDDTLDGGAGADQIDAGGGNDIVFGGDGNDTIERLFGGDAGVMTIDGGAGFDILHLHGGSLDAGTTITGIEVVLLSNGPSNTFVDPHAFDSIGTIWGLGGFITLSSPGVMDLSAKSYPDSFFWFFTQRTNASFLLNGSSGDDTVTLPADAGGRATLNGREGDDVLTGGADNDSLFGNAGDDVLIGRGGDDFLNWDGGSDVLNGGDANDSITLTSQDAAPGVLTIEGGAGHDLLYIWEGVLAPGTTISGIEALVLTFGNTPGGPLPTQNIVYTPGVFPTTGTLFAGGATLAPSTGGTTDFSGMTAPASFNAFYASAFSASLRFLGSSGADVFRIGENNPVRITAFGNEGDDALHGGSMNDDLSGDDGSDVLSAFGGGDFLNGGAGDDVLIGGAGGDNLNGGLGRDTASYVNAAGAVTASLAFGIRTGDAAEDVYSSIENLTGSNFADTLTGDDAANVLSGLDGDDSINAGLGDDQLIGGAGADRLEGAGGDDRFVLGVAIDGVDQIFGGFEAADSGFDTLDYSSAQAGAIVQLSGYSTTSAGALLAAFSGIEGAIGSNFSDSLIGNEAHNRFAGGAGADWIVGGGGDDWFIQGIESSVDRLFGDAGVDTIDYAGAGAGVTVQLSGYATSGGATLALFSGIEAAVGSAFDDVLIGTGLGNRFTDGAGSDWVVGQGGDDWFVQSAAPGVDRLFGDAGTDTIDYSTASAGVNVQLNGWSATTGGALLATFTGMEDAVGSAFNDALVGTNGDNRIAGGQGLDWLVGGGGNDTFVQTIDTSSVDRLFGGAPGGVDAGFDTIDYSSAIVGVIVQLSGYATTKPGAFAVTLATFTGIEGAVGSNFADALIGNAADNRLTGGGGADWLVGGAGADTFIYLNAASGADTIADFSRADLDRIDLSAIDADPTQAGDQFFTLATSRTSGRAGEAVVENFGASSLVSLYLDADNVADMTLQVVHQNGLVMNAGDFVL